MFWTVVLFSLGIDIAHILQGYFTGTGAILASEVTLTEMGKYITWTHNET